MMWRIKLLGLIAAFLVMFLPSFTVAQGFSVFPAEVKIDDLPPGQGAEFELTIRNKDEIAHNFTFTTFQPPEEERRAGRAEFPDESWVSFSPQEIEVPANSETNVAVMVAVPREGRWTDQDWEIWLGVASESTDLLAVKLYVRLLVSTSATGPNTALVGGIAAGIVLISCGAYYYFRRRTKPQRV
ncbi:MAG: hypothetical protein HXY36_00930 [Chloroflexi bacterium]|nr:hypothetical protein [Chloroflexota bacterium]